MAKLSDQWKTGTTIVYKTELQGMLWKGEIVEQDGIWRRIRWEDGNLPSWLGVERLNKRAKKLTQQKAAKPTPSPRAKKVKIPALQEVLSLEA